MRDSDNQIAEPLAEPLTTREEEILALLAQQRSAAEIAKELTLAVSTVKWYIQQLYGKLGVNSKRQALARARELGLVAGAPAAPAAPAPAAPPKPARTDNLPVQVTRFFGRENEIAQLKQRLADHRLITLTGSGGVGKSRLSLQVARDLRAEFADGVWLVELAPLTDPALVPAHVAQALGVRETPDRPILDSLTLFLSDRQALLVLDNCEHLLEACAQLAEALLRAADRLRILASSREPLNIGGEAVYGVRSLPFPDPAHPPPLDQLSEFAAIRLFVDRARLVMPDYQAAEHNAQALARICQRLDGIPLAIELAAARVNVLSAERLAGRLEDAFRVLTGGTRTALPRQQTLRATIDWSYELLSKAERQLLERLSVFAGGCTLEAAEVVCADGAEAGPEPAAPTIGGVEILELLSGLVRKSMVTADRRTGEETRYTLLETVRQYAREKLHAAGEGERLRARHLDYFSQLAQEAEPELKGPEQLEWLNRLTADLDNVRAALDYSLTSSVSEAVEAGLRLAVALEYFWVMRAYSGMAPEKWLDAALAPGRVPARSLIRANALCVAAAHIFSSDLDKLLAQAEESVAIYREAGAAGRRGLGYALLALGLVRHNRNEFAHCIRLYEESIGIFREVGDQWGLAMALGHLAATRDPLVNYGPGGEDGAPAPLPELAPAARNDHAAEIALYEQGLALFRALGDRWAQCRILGSLGHTYLCSGELAASRAMLEEYLRVAREFGDLPNMGSTLNFQMGRLALARDDLDEAERILDEARTTLRAAGQRDDLTWFLRAELARRRDQHAHASEQLSEGMSAIQSSGNRDFIAAVLDGQGRVARSQGDLAAAHALHMEAMGLRRHAGHPIALAHSFHALALLAAEHAGQAERAARLFGAAQPYDAALYGFWYPLPIWRAEHERGAAKVRARLGDESADRLWAEGEAMTLAQAYAYALET